MIPAIFPSKSWSTWEKRVLEGFPEIFAEGPAIGNPASRMSFRVDLWRGILNATVSNHQLTASGMQGFLEG